MKFSTTTAASCSRQLQTVARVASTRSAVQALSGVQSPPARRASSCAPPTWRSACASRSRPRSARPGEVVLPGAAAARRRPPAARRDVVARAAAAEQDVEIIAGAATLPPAHAARRGLPAAARAAAATASSRCRPRRSSRRSRKVARSASRDETRPILTGILVSASGDELRMVATDSYRLSVKETKLDAAARRRLRGQRPGPRAAGARAHRAARSARRRSTIGVRANQVVFEVGGDVLSSRLIDGQFPNYRQLLPETYEHELRVAGEELAERRAPHQPAWRRRTRRCAWPSPRAS